MTKYLDDEGLRTFNDDLNGKFASYEEVQTMIGEMSSRLTNYDILCVVDDTIDTYKIRITTEYTKKQNGTLIGYTNGHFDYLTYKDCLTPADPSNLVENIVLTNEDGIDFNCVLTISSRNTDNNRDDNAPHNMFAPSNKRISPNNKVLCLENSDSFTMEIDFIERVPYRYASDLRFTVFNNGGDFTVTYEVINSNNEVVYTDVTEVEEYNSEIDDMVSSGADTFKIVLTVTEPGNGNTAHLSTGSFENLEYDTCLSPRSATALTEEVVFTDGEHSYNCTISVSSRWNDNGRDDYAPHNLFAPSGKRVSGWQGINASTTELLICTIQFTDYIPLDKLDNLTVYAGWNSSGYNDRYVEYVKYELYNSNDELLYEETKENLTNSGDYAMTFSHGLSGSSSDDKYYKMVITKTGNGTDSWGTTLAHGVFENLTYTGRKTQNYTSNITSVDVYFADESENVIECTCSYLSGRWSDNGKRNYAPCDFFATSQEQAWDDNDNTASYSEIMSNNKNSDLIVEFSFKTKMPLENLNNLTFDNGRYSASNVNVKVYSSDDLETYTEIIDMDLVSGSSYTFTFDPSTI